MNKLTKKLLLSVFAVVVTVFALGTTTFAWFTITNVATVQQFEVQVVADEGIEMRLNYTGAPTGTEPAAWENRWVTSFTKQDVESYIGIMQPSFKFSQVTSANGTSFFTLGASALTATSSGYLQVRVDFRSNNATSINWTSVSLDSTGVGFAPDVAFKLTNGDDVTPSSVSAAEFKAANAARISITDGTNKVVFENDGVALGVEASTRGANTVLGDLTTTDGTLNGSANSLYAGALSYYLAKTSAYPVTAESISVVATQTEIDNDKVLDMATDLLNLTTHTNSGFITIRVWLEGWDPDMYNAILSDTLKIAFSFEGQA